MEQNYVLNFNNIYFLSDNLTTCYMPDYKIRNDRSHQTFKYPLKNTILYSISEY